MKFKVGDKVRIKEWNEMEREFGLTSKGNINCMAAFIADMKKVCGKYATVAGINGVRIYLNIDGMGWTNWVYTEDMIKPAGFTKADLKEGMVLETRRGRRFMVVNGNGIGLDTYLSLDDYADDLLCNNTDSGDIMKVFKVNGGGAPFKHMLNIGSLIWERKEPKVKELTTEEAIELLKAKFAEFDEIRIK